MSEIQPIPGVRDTIDCLRLEVDSLKNKIKEIELELNIYKQRAQSIPPEITEGLAQREKP